MQMYVHNLGHLPPGMFQLYIECLTKMEHEDHA
jgi:hypothetical protein